MQQNASEASVWIQFFKDSAIPDKYVQLYTNKFTENRIRLDMLADLDRPLLNDLGITAIGDCLSILKHAKTWTPKMPDLTSKKNEVAKRIIGSYISKSPSPSDSESEKSVKVSLSKKQTQKSVSSTLSADLASRLNFNPVGKPGQERVTSTTNDEGIKDVVSKKSNKRKLDSDEEDTIVKAPVLEYRGFLKNNSEAKTVIRLVNNKRVLSVNEPKKIDAASMKRTISVQPTNKKLTISTGTNKASSKVQTQPAKTLQLKKFDSLKSDFNTKSVFDRINTTLVNSSEVSSTSQALSQRISKGATKANQFTKNPTNTTIDKKFTITLNNHSKSPKNRTITPITFGTDKTQLKKNQNNKLNSVVRTVNQMTSNNRKTTRDVFSRISL